MKNITSMIGGAAVTAAAAVSMTTGLAPASAAAGVLPPTLSITQDEVDPATARLVVFGTFAMDGPDAHGFINNLNTGTTRGGMRFEIWGFDGFGGHVIDNDADHRRPDYVFLGARNEPAGHLYASDEGIQYRRVINVPKGVLNEDNHILDQDDEIYVRAVFVDGDGGERWQQTNQAHGQF
jgi:hypothetical protein